MDRDLRLRAECRASMQIELRLTSPNCIQYTLVNLDQVHHHPALIGIVLLPDIIILFIINTIHPTETLWPKQMCRNCCLMLMLLLDSKCRRRLFCTVPHKTHIHRCVMRYRRRHDYICIPCSMCTIWRSARQARGNDFRMSPQPTHTFRTLGHSFNAQYRKIRFRIGHEGAALFCAHCFVKQQQDRKHKLLERLLECLNMLTVNYK